MWSDRSGAPMPSEVSIAIATDPPATASTGPVRLERQSQPVNASPIDGSALIDRRGGWGMALSLERQVAV